MGKKEIHAVGFLGALCGRKRVRLDDLRANGADVTCRSCKQIWADAMARLERSRHAEAK